MSSRRRKCCLVTCPGKSTKFFNFPTQEPKRSEWLGKCHESLQNILQLKHPLICNLHFENKYFGKKKLFPESIPSLYLETSDICENDFTMEELDNLDNFIFPESSENSLENPPCKHCHKREKCVDWYRRENERLRKKCDVVLKRNILLKKNYGIQKKLLTSAKKTTVKNKQKYSNLKKLNVNDFIDCDENLSPQSKTFCKMILKSTNCYTKEEKELAQVIFFKSSSVYSFLRERLGFHLPSLRSLYNWLPLKNLKVGENENLLLAIKQTVQNFEIEKKQVILIFDEIKIKKDLAYNNFHDVVDGFVDNGIESEARSPYLSNYVIVFMVRSLYDSWKQVIWYSASQSGVTHDILKTLVEKNVELCEKVGLNVRALCCDQATSNQKFYEKLEVTKMHPFWQRENKKIYCLHDIPHLIKCFRNNLTKYDLVMEEGDVASWKIIKEVYALEQQSITRMCPKLTNKHVVPNTFDKMKVKLAVQVFSSSASAAIRTMYSLNKFSENIKSNALPTAKVATILNNFFDSCNSKRKYSKNPYNAGLMRDNLPQKTLVETKEFLLKCEFAVNKKGVKINCIKGLQQTIEGILQLSVDIFDEFEDWKYLCVHKLNQDPLENLFSKIRYKKNNPTLAELNDIIRRVVAVKFINSSVNANCQEDTDDIMEMDWNAIIEDISVNEYCDSVQDFEEVEFDITLTSSNIENLDNTEECSNFPNAEKSSVGCLTDNSVTYFSGFVMEKMLKKGICKDCVTCANRTILAEPTLETTSQLLTHYKNYKINSDFGSLKVPTKQFFELCKGQTEIINNFFLNHGHKKNLISEITKLCIQSFDKWYDIKDECYFHKLKILDYFTLVLIRKMCRWKAEQMIQDCGKIQNQKKVSKNRKLNILQS